MRRGTSGRWRQSAARRCALPSCDARAGSRPWHLYGLSQVHQRLLAHFQDPFLRSIEIGNEPDDHRKGESHGKLGQRSARAREARVIAHGGERQDGDRAQCHPDGTRNGPGGSEG